MTHAGFAALGRTLALDMMEYVQTKLAPSSARIDALEKRVQQLEGTTLPKWAGTWEAKDYRQGNLVTRDGSLWLATADTRERPGDGNTGWRLIVKRGAYQHEARA